MHANRSYALIAALIVVGTTLVAPPRHLAAQGGQKMARPAAPAPPTADAQPTLQPARSVVQQLVGRWRFAIWFAGNFDGPPDASGTRVVDTLFNDLRLQWSEEVDHSGNRSQGIIGFDPKTGRFYSSAVYSDGTGPEFLTGTMSPGEPLVTFTPVTPAPNTGRRLMESFTMTLIDQDHFTWVPLDRGWRAVFTRER
jgi:hypothetical protein